MLEWHKRKQSIFDSPLKLSKWQAIVKWKVGNGMKFLSRIFSRGKRTQTISRGLGRVRATVQRPAVILTRSVCNARQTVE